MPTDNKFLWIKGKTVAKTLRNRHWNSEDGRYHSEPTIIFTDGSSVTFHNDVDENAGVDISVYIKKKEG